MGKGLKTLVEEASATKQVPVTISPEARRALSEKVREWTGWRDGVLNFGRPTVSPYAECDHTAHMITVNPEPLILNPNRVLLTVTPFRLRQEAVLTGAVLHEAGHARHSKWMPRTKEEAEAKPLLHSDGTVPTNQTVALARLMEEARVEGLIAAEADHIGATGLDWTMRASAAHLVPMTSLAADPAQKIMDLITSWALRAGRQAGLNFRVGHKLPGWVGAFTSLLHQTIEVHLTERVEQGADLDGDTPNYRSLQVIAMLNAMIQCDDDTGPTMIDAAAEALRLLFPETDDEDDSDAADDEAMPGAGCEEPESEEEEEEQESEQQGEASDDEADAGATDSTDEGEPEDGEAGADGDEDGDESDEQGSGEGESGDESSEPAEGEQGSDQASDDDPLARALAQMEAQAQEQVEDEATDEAEQAPPMEGSSAGAGGGLGGGWRMPTKPEREIAKGAEQFLRRLIDASETSKRMLTDQPAAVVDGAALSAWKAGGQVREPHFFIRTRRFTEPSPPIKIAILVDVSASMDDLQKPSALLSWSLASAALDLRNFAGRGQQIESCLIHWGDNAEVIQRPGQIIPGIREARCDQGTSNMHGAMDMIEEVIPGFFDITEQPVNRLLVQFTDWKIFGIRHATERVSRALEAGVNMLSVVPTDYNPRWTPLNDILRECKIQRGAASLVKYNPARPEDVWNQASEVLNGQAPDAAASYGF